MSIYVEYNIILVAFAVQETLPFDEQWWATGAVFQEPPITAGDQRKHLQVVWQWYVLNTDNFTLLLSWIKGSIKSKCDFDEVTTLEPRTFQLPNSEQHTYLKSLCVTRQIIFQSMFLRFFPSDMLYVIGYLISQKLDNTGYIWPDWRDAVNGFNGPIFFLITCDHTESE